MLVPDQCSWRLVEIAQTFTDSSLHVWDIIIVMKVIIFELAELLEVMLGQLTLG